jgi:hypothetical protein
MLPLFDMLANAQNGKGVELLARQFNLTQQQTELALEALLPAFSQGLKRNTSDPYGIAGFMTALASGQHGQYFDNASRAFSPDGMADGNGILGHLFGSKDLSRAVASQAAQATGIGQNVLQQMLPAIAAMLMGGLFKQSTNQLQAGSFGASNPLGEIIEQMMRQGGGGGATPRQQPQPQAAPDPFDNPFGKVLKDMFGGGAAAPGAPQRQPAPEAGGDNPFGKILQDMLGGGAAAPSAPQRGPSPDIATDNPFGKILQDMLGGGAPEPQAAPDPQQSSPRPRANPSGRAKNPYDDIFGDMFETGRKTRDDYQKGMESVFDQFLRGMDNPR